MKNKNEKDNTIEYEEIKQNIRLTIKYHEDYNKITTLEENEMFNFDIDIKDFEVENESEEELYERPVKKIYKPLNLYKFNKFYEDIDESKEESSSDEDDGIIYKKSNKNLKFEEEKRVDFFEKQKGHSDEELYEKQVKKTYKPLNLYKFNELYEETEESSSNEEDDCILYDNLNKNNYNQQKNQVIKLDEECLIYDDNQEELKERKRKIENYNRIIKYFKSFCIHKIKKNSCKECNKYRYCKHLRDKYNCYECDGRHLCVFCKLTSANKKYEKHCFRCYIHLFPDKPVSKNYKTKEIEITSFIITNFPNFQWYEDKRIIDGCSRRRPDLLLDLGYQVLVIEIDENQHKIYGDSCESKRLMELSQDIGGRPMILIRFNPDGYLNTFGVRIKSCWEIHKITGICIVKNTMKKEWIQRLNTLKKQIDYWVNEDNKSDKIVHIVYLYYDGYI